MGPPLCRGMSLSDACRADMISMPERNNFLSKRNAFRKEVAYTQKKLFKIILNQPEIRLYLPFSDWFGTKQTSVCLQINRKMVNTIWFQIDLIRFRKDFSVCRGRYRAFPNHHQITVCVHLVG